MEHMIKFSIIIPIYNRAKFISASVGSAIEQTYENIEVICVDDASTDDSLKILEGLQQKDSRIKIVKHQKNMGTHMARKTGVENASGDYILFLDCDDQLATNACEVLEYELKKDDCDILAFAHNDNGLVRSPSPKLNAENLFENLVYNGHKTQPEIWAKCYKVKVAKKAFSEIQNFYSIMAQDVIEVVIIAYHAKSYRNIKNVLHYYSRNIKGTTNSKKTASAMKKYLLSEKNDIEALRDFFKDKDNGENIVLAVERKLYEDMLDKIKITVKLYDCKKVSDMLINYFSAEVIETTPKKINFASSITMFRITLYRFAKKIFHSMPNSFQVFCRKIKFSKQLKS